MRREIRLAHYSWRTEQSYAEAAARFLNHFPNVAPDALTDAHIKSYLEHLAVERNVSASTQNQAFSAILFLFRRVLGHDLGNLELVEGQAILTSESSFAKAYGGQVASPLDRLGALS